MKTKMIAITTTVCSSFLKRQFLSFNLFNEGKLNIGSEFSAELRNLEVSKTDHLQH